MARRESIFGTRLKLARKKAGLSLQELSDSIQNRITKQAINKYESGQMAPSSDIIPLLSEALDVKPDYFFKKNVLTLGKVLFRKKVRMSKRLEESIIEKVRDYIERYLEIENILNIQSSFKNPLEGFANQTKEDVEVAAKKLRQFWDLGSGPILNLIEILELRGVKVLLLNEVEDFDGLAVFSESGLPIVAVNTRGKSIERLRFTIIHELAHLLLHLDYSNGNDSNHEEVLCHYFGSCFLLPTEILLNLIGDKRSYIRIEELISIKESYGISIRATTHRLKDLLVVTETYYRRWMIYLSKTYGAKNEPGQFKGEERAKNFELLVNRALAEELISISKASILLNTNITNLTRKDFDIR